MAKIQIFGQLEAVTAEGILADSQQIKYSDTTVSAKFVALDEAIASKQNTLTFDSAPTSESSNPVTSGGVYTSVNGLDTRLTSVENGLGTSSSTPSATGTTAWSRLLQAQNDIATLKSGLGTSADSPSATGTTAWSRLLKAQSDISDINTKIGTSTDTASSSSTVVWPRLLNAETDIDGLQGQVGTSSDSPSPSGTTVWSRLLNAESDISSLQSTISGMDESILYMQDATVASAAWTSSGDATYPYKADVSMLKVTSSFIPMVQFSDTDAYTYEFSSTVTPGTNKVTIYCKTQPGVAITIPMIICFKGVLTQS